MRIISLSLPLVALMGLLEPTVGFHLRPIQRLGGITECRKALEQALGRAAVTAIVVTSLVSSGPLVAHAASPDTGASSGANAKITTGGASTLQSGRTIAITRGVNLDNSDFRGQNLRGVAFQQSIVRDADFRDSNLVGASFFDATVDGSDFENADLSLASKCTRQKSRIF